MNPLVQVLPTGVYLGTPPPDAAVVERSPVSVEVRRRVAREVEVDTRDVHPHHAPHSFAQLRDNLHQLEPGKPRVGDLPEVAAQQSFILRIGQLVMNGEIRQIEVEVAHSRIFPVYDADARPIIDQVRLPEVIMAGNECPSAAHRRLDLTKPPTHRVNVTWDRRGRLAGHGQVLLERVERGERTLERRPSMIT